MLKGLQWLCFGVVLVLASAAQGAEVSRQMLRQLGLGSLERLPDRAGQEVRGASASARSAGSSSFALFLFDPFSGTTVQIQGADSANSSESNSGLQQGAGANQTNTTAFSGFTQTITTGVNTTSWTIGVFTIGPGSSMSSGN